MLRYIFIVCLCMILAAVKIKTLIFRRENWRKRGGPSPALEIEAQDLRIIATRITMDQNAETNGCDDSPVSVGVSNHTEIVQVNLEMLRKVSIVIFAGIKVNFLTPF